MKQQQFSRGTGGTLCSFPVSLQQIVDTVKARGDGRCPSWMAMLTLRPSLREAVGFWDNPPRTWEIVEYGGERSHKELVYSI